MSASCSEFDNSLQQDKFELPAAGSKPWFIGTGRDEFMLYADPYLAKVQCLSLWSDKVAFNKIVS
jgi:hypothetical protein